MPSCFQLGLDKAFMVDTEGGEGVSVKCLQEKAEVRLWLCRKCKPHWYQHKDQDNHKDNDKKEGEGKKKDIVNLIVVAAGYKTYLKLMRAYS